MSNHSTVNMRKSVHIVMKHQIWYKASLDHADLIYHIYEFPTTDTLTFESCIMK